MSFAMNPSDHVDVFLALAPEDLAADTTFNLVAGIDMQPYEYMQVIVAAGTTDTALSVTLQHESTAAPSTPATIEDAAGVDKIITLTAGQDDSAKSMEVRCHGLDRYLHLEATTLGGATGEYSIIVLGYRGQYSEELGGMGNAVVKSEIDMT